MVWWDPSKLELNVDAGLGLRQKELLADDGGISLAAYREWEKQRTEMLESGSIPQYRVLIASQSATGPPGEEIPVKIELVAGGEARPHGRRYGTLVHSILRDVELDAKPAAIARFAQINARSIGAPAEERDAAAAAVKAALAHPLMRRAHAAARSHREYPVMFKLDDGWLVDGVIDLAFVENETWHVVDFKTDVDADSKLPRFLCSPASVVRLRLESHDRHACPGISIGCLGMPEDRMRLIRLSELLQLRCIQLYVQRRDSVLQVRQFARTDDRRRDSRLVQQPCHGDLRV